MKLRCLQFVVLALLVNGCATSKLGWKPQPGGETQPDTPRYVEDFDPKTLHGQELLITRTLDESETEAASKTAKPAVQANADEAQGTVMGYRVQLKAGKNEAAIIEEKQKAMMKFNVPVYVEFDTPQYKLRIGDCLTEHEANLLRDRARRNGYVEAWRVRCLVNRSAQGNR